MITELICFSLSGFFMKLSDELMDEKNNLSLAILTGIICVIASLWVSKINGDACCIFISILIGTLLASKVDTINHICSAILFIAILVYLGLPQFSWYCLVLCIIAAFVDEKGNDKSDEIENSSSSEKGVLYLFFKYRYMLKLMVFILSLLGLINGVFTNTFLSNFVFFEPITIVYFYCFELAYEFADLIFNRIYNVF